MSSKKESAALVGAGAAACAVCCAGPIIGFLTAIGIGTAAGIALFGAIGVAIAASGVAIVLGRRRRRSSSCEVAATPVAIESPTVRTRL
jgi:hypothetical protein